MAIDVSLYLPVSSSINATLNNTRVFAGLGLSINPLIPTTQPILQFTSAASVATYFGSSSSESIVATKYFKTSDTALASPRYIYFGKFVIDAIAPYLRSAVSTNTTALLASIKTVTAGQMSVSVNGTVYPTTGIDLSGATSLSNAASLLTTAITTANAALVTASFTITWDGTFKQFVASIPGTGAIKTMDYFSSTGSPAIATIMKFTQATGAILSQGADAIASTSASTNLDNLVPYIMDQYSIAFVDDLGGDLDDDINLSISQWVDTQNTPQDKYNFFCWSDESALELSSSADTTSIWYLINEAGYNSSSIFDEVLLSNAQRAFAMMGIFASLDLTQKKSALTAAFKTQTGLAPSVTQTSIAENLDEKKINYYGNVGISGSTNQKNWFYGGYTTGKWKYIDNQVGQIWISYQIQVSLADLFSVMNQVPNDPDGQGMIRSQLTSVMDQSIFNGIIGVGVVFDNATSQEIKTTYGVSAQELTNNGYIIVNNATSQALREIRESSPWFVLYVKASAIQYLPVQTKTYF